MAAGHGEKMTRKQEQAVAALLSERTVKAAAAACGVSEVTLWRWLQDPDFRGRYREARRMVVERAIGELQQACGEAVGALKRNLTCGSAAVEVRSAQVILEQAVKAVELIDLQGRVERLEATLSEREGPDSGRGKGWA